MLSLQSLYYSNSILESMATKHVDHEHYAEAAMCKIHCAALVSEYLHMLEDRQYMPVGAITFSNLTPNAVEGSFTFNLILFLDCFHK